MRPTVRAAVAADRDAVARMRCALWPDDPPEEHAREVEATLRGEPNSILPLTILIAEVDGFPAGFAEVGLRSHAEGCDPRRPVGYLEGWFVEEKFRRRGVGRALVEAGMAWAKARGCREFASDTWADARHSIAAHQRLGFKRAGCCVNFRRPLD